MTQALNVEYDELIARAAELEQPMPTPPPDNPQAPCALSFVVDAATQIALSADQMRVYLNACEREWRRLAQSLRNAAKAYEQVDEDAAGAVANNTSVSRRRRGARRAAVTRWWPSAIRTRTTCCRAPGCAAGPAGGAVLRGTASSHRNRSTGPGNRVQRLCPRLDTYQRVLQSTINRFRPFTNWEGTSRAGRRTQLRGLPDLCDPDGATLSTLSAQAKNRGDEPSLGRPPNIPRL